MSLMTFNMQGKNVGKQENLMTKIKSQFVGGPVKVPSNKTSLKLKQRC